ncbi:MAG: transcriptional regulator [Halobacteria archaeon]
MDEKTTREEIADILRRDSMTARQLAEKIDGVEEAVYSNLEHVRKSLRDTDEVLLASPPECRDCGFDGFDDVINMPSRCPECKSMDIGRPVFKIE